MVTQVFTKLTFSNIWRSHWVRGDIPLTNPIVILFWLIVFNKNIDRKLSCMDCTVTRFASFSKFYPTTKKLIKTRMIKDVENNKSRKLN